mmetsp:Transcript_11403/g.29398  ORF Transcript_11403/g.29398 Transcript_11403/m.29398 type:complete len:83 (-) Transcript_11403:1535-1783(-)
MPFRFGSSFTSLPSKFIFVGLNPFFLSTKISFFSRDELGLLASLKGAMRCVRLTDAPNFLLLNYQSPRTFHQAPPMPSQTKR